MADLLGDYGLTQNIPMDRIPRPTIKPYGPCLKDYTHIQTIYYNQFVMSNTVEEVKQLIEEGFNISFIPQALRYQDLINHLFANPRMSVDILKFLLEQKLVDPYELNDKGNSCIAYQQGEEQLKTILSHMISDGNINFVFTRNNDGETCLVRFAKYSNFDCFKVFFDRQFWYNLFLKHNNNNWDQSTVESMEEFSDYFLINLLSGPIITRGMRHPEYPTPLFYLDNFNSLQIFELFMIARGLMKKIIMTTRDQVNIHHFNFITWCMFQNHKALIKTCSYFKKFDMLADSDNLWDRIHFELGQEHFEKYLYFIDVSNDRSNISPFTFCYHRETAKLLISGKIKPTLEVMEVRNSIIEFMKINGDGILPDDKRFYDQLLRHLIEVEEYLKPFVIELPSWFDELDYHSGGEVCQICHESEGEIRSLKCHKTHVFHKKCIEGWRQIKSVCPSCQTEI